MQISNSFAPGIKFKEHFFLSIEKQKMEYIIGERSSFQSSLRQAQTRNVYRNVIAIVVCFILIFWYKIHIARMLQIIII